jgi:glycerate kinase
MRIVIAPLEFKGTLTAREAAAAMSRGLQRGLPAAVLAELPMADGGPGTLDVLAPVVNATMRTTSAQDSLGRPVEARWASMGNDAALIETAEAVGLSLIAEKERDVVGASSFGAGQLILAALEHGAKRLFVGLGGSATNDGGRGMLEALGVRFGSSEAEVDLGGLRPELRKVEIVALADVRNELLGERGATMVYAVQKGARAADLVWLEQRMSELAESLETAFGVQVRNEPGTGAAGGLGFALRLLGARILSGSDVVARMIGLPEQMKSAQALMTGEGSLDDQTDWGKGVSYLLDLARKSHVPAYGIFGQVRRRPMGFEQVVSLEEQAGSLTRAVEGASTEVERAAYLFAATLKHN